jgi:uncharacterized protein YecE (DUF72 family)
MANQRTKAAGPGRIRVGTSGWCYPEWRGNFYPKALPAAQWFAHYATQFNTVELNSTFYRVPGVQIFQAWAARAPAGFVYALKASREVTHRDAGDQEQVLQAMTDGASALGDHLGPVLYQFPPWLRCDLPRLDAFLERLPQGFHHVLEFRHPSWYTPEVERRLEHAAVGFCIHDMRGSASPGWVTGPVAYVRLHGPGQAKYTGRYGPARLRRLAARLLSFARLVPEVAVYFNNTAAGDAPADAQALRELLTEAALTK